MTSHAYKLEEQTWHKNGYFRKLPISHIIQNIEKTSSISPSASVLLWNMSSCTNFVFKTAFDSPCIQASRTNFWY